MTPRVTLIGLPGVGKSTAGVLVAQELGVPFVDVGSQVEQALGGSAAEYVANHGEAPYHRAEIEQSLAAIRGDGVIALPSGAANEEIAAALQGPVIWLQASVATITRRLGMHQLGMPTLIALRNRMEHLAQQRALWYSSVATATVSTERLDAAGVAAAILAELEK